MAEIFHTTLDPGKLDLVTEWLATQRWYAAKGRMPRLTRLDGYRLDDPAGEVGIETMLVRDDAGGRPVVYQVALTYRGEPLPGAEHALLGTMEHGVLGTRWVYDAPHDPVYAERLLALCQGRAVAQHATTSFTSEPRVSGRPQPGVGPVTVRSSKVLAGEQSNTSIIYDAVDVDGAPAHVICKVFRMVQPGENPDVVVQGALASAGSGRVPSSFGSVEAAWRIEPDGDAHAARGHLAFAQEFLPGSRDAWREALEAAQAGRDFTGEAFALGAATAQVHTVLARALPTHEGTTDDRAVLADEWRTRRAAAVAEAPDLARHDRDVEAVFERALQVEWPVLQRVHGDYHLGQVLDAPGRGWVLLDFEGEPLRPLAQRNLPDLPLRDVAGMLRSFDYAAGSVQFAARTARAPDAEAVSERAARWASACRDAFVDGYASVAGDPRSDEAGRALLAALELDKALYEVVYEARNRPSWLRIPASAIARLAGSASPAVQSATSADAAHAAGSADATVSAAAASSTTAPTAPTATVPSEPTESVASAPAGDDSGSARSSEPEPARATPARRLISSAIAKLADLASPSVTSTPTSHPAQAAPDERTASMSATSSSTPNSDADPADNATDATHATDAPDARAGAGGAVGSDASHDADDATHATDDVTDPNARGDAGDAARTAAASRATGPRPVNARELDLLVGGGHGDPHSILGAHPHEGGVTVRALRPLAEQVEVDLPDGSRHPMTHEHEGVWVVHVSAAQPSDYRLRVTYDGDESVQDDAYRFLPTVGEVDLHLIGEGRHEQLWTVLGSHVREYDGAMGHVVGTSFAVWGPNARAVRVIGAFNGWSGQNHPMRALGSTGVWELFVPDVAENTTYKYEILGADGYWRGKADPMARATECPPQTASVVTRSRYRWSDDAWMQQRAEHTEPHERPMSVYECHLGSWRQGSSYVDLAEHLVNYVSDLGFTHVEFMPVMEHPYGPSWGYQVTGYYAPTSRFGSPDEFRYLVDRLHQAGIGVILDWVPGHFPKDSFALAKFDGQALYEHPDPRRGDQPDWGTHVFDFGRPQVRNFLVANASYWIEEFHVDGLRVDAVASMLYLDYSRNDGEWLPNRYGGREHLEAVELLQEMNATVYRRNPGAVTIAEESTSWPGISRPTYSGGLGFGLKWNMGWMHDTLAYVAQPPVYRQYHHGQITFSMIYQYSENFCLPISHDEVVYGKGSMLRKMPGDRWEQLAGLRGYYAFMWSHPGKQLLFMGQEFAQESEWADARSLDWWLLDHEPHWKMHALLKDLNALYASRPALWSLDNDPAGFAWIDANDAAGNVLSFLRFGREDERGARPMLASVINFSGAEHQRYRVGLPRPGVWREVLNTDSVAYGGGGSGNLGQVVAEETPWHGQPYSALVTLPKLAAVWFEPEDADTSGVVGATEEAPVGLRAQTPGVQRPELSRAPVVEESAVRSDLPPEAFEQAPVGLVAQHAPAAPGEQRSTATQATGSAAQDSNGTETEGVEGAGPERTATAPDGAPAAEPAPTSGGWAPAVTPRESGQVAPDPAPERGADKDAPRVDPGLPTQD